MLLIYLYDIIITYIESTIQHSLASLDALPPYNTHLPAWMPSHHTTLTCQPGCPPTIQHSLASLDALPPYNTHLPAWMPSHHTTLTCQPGCPPTIQHSLASLDALPPYNTHLPAWMPSHVEVSLIRIFSLLMPASSYNLINLSAFAIIASLSNDSLKCYNITYSLTQDSQPFQCHTNIC